MGKEHSTPEKPSYRLIGKPPMTEEERAAFLQQARAAEAQYDNEVRVAAPFGGNRSALRSQAVHVVESGLELKYHANYPENLIADVHAKIWALEENLKLLDSDLPSKTPGSTYADDRVWLQEKMTEMHAGLENSLNRLDKIYQEKLEYDYGTPHQIREREKILEEITNSRTKLEMFESEWHKSEWYKAEAKADVDPKADIDAMQKADVDAVQIADVDATKAAWHKQWVDPSQPLQFTEGLRRTAALARDADLVDKTPQFKPNVAPDNPRALYTHSGETDPTIAWHKDPQHFSHHLPISDEALKRTGKLGLIAVGLLTAAEAANAMPGTLSEKLDAAGEVLKEMSLDAIPGRTYLQKMQAEEYEAAALDAASYLPLGDIVGMARSPEAQAVIDALPKGRKELELMMADKAEAPINNYLAQYQLILMEAKNRGELLKGLDFSSGLTDLAEKKIIMQAQWAKNAEVFKAVISDPSTDWNQVKKTHPEIALHLTAHLAAVNTGRPSIFVAQVDANLTESLARGRLLTVPEASFQQSPSFQQSHSMQGEALSVN